MQSYLVPDIKIIAIISGPDPHNRPEAEIIQRAGLKKVPMCQNEPFSVPGPQLYIEFSYFRLRSGGGVVGTSKVDADDELEEVSDSEFDKLLDEQERGWENKTGKKFDYNYIATPKERKKMKRKNEHKMDSEFQELDDDEPDFDDLYSDQSDHDEGSDDAMDFEGTFLMVT